MSVTTPKGFRAAGVAAGLKESGARDVAVVVNDGPTTIAAGVFTSNRIKAAPVVWTQQVVSDNDVKVVVLNSGGANACTGPDGFADTHQTAEFVANALKCGAGEVAVCSTGLIGVRLPMDKLTNGISAAISELSDQGGDSAAHAIMTTDTVSKQTAVAGDGFMVGGMAKGAGMLAPGLATMLAVITTDAVIDAELAQRALSNATSRTFDRIDSDGCMSTNDTVLLLASGASGITPLAAEFIEAVEGACGELARGLIADCEGATKDIKIVVGNAATEDQAVTAARTISRSNLLKCAIHGEDPNWGRVLSALGTTDVTFEPDQVDVAINGVWVCRNSSVGEDRAGVSMDGRVVQIDVDLKAGNSVAAIWTNDLTADYVHENSAYST